ncbi:TPA: hypothetical protein IX553_002886 [Enterococcus faecium]|nr:hypothetical protein [Enterococcus faecium]HAQ7565180.1 hypothetical protein [Enterococcus faecium]
MEVEQIKYQGMDREWLIDVIEQQRLELIQKEAVCKEYKKRLEQVIEYHSVEKYRSVVQKNRATSPDPRQDVSISIKTPVFNSVKSEKLESISTALVEKAAEMNSLANEVSRLI